jgi:hypothetical protein
MENRDRRHYDEFKETLATPIPNDNYRSSVESGEDRTSIADRIIRYAAVILGLLLAIRFVSSLFTANVGNPLVNFFRVTTNWIVSPFQAVIGSSASSVGGFYDWPALVALAAVVVIAALLISLMRPRDTY